MKLNPTQRKRLPNTLVRALRDWPLPDDEHIDVRTHRVVTPGVGAEEHHLVQGQLPGKHTEPLKQLLDHLGPTHPGVENPDRTR